MTIPHVSADRLVLASASPRRRELLERIGVAFEVRPADLDETPRAGEEPSTLARRLAADKARAVAADADGAWVLGADTVVDLDGVTFGKPSDDLDAGRMLRALAGRTHRVHTGVAVSRPDGSLLTEVVTTSVTFAELSDELIAWYVATGEPADKAGAYGLQGIGAALVERIDGSVSNVLGLPLTTVRRLLGPGG